MFYKVKIALTYCLLVSMMSSFVMAQEASKDPVSYTIEAPEMVQVGDVFTINTVFNIQPSWYVYAPVALNTSKGKIPTKVTFKVPEGVKKINGLELPDKNRFFDTYSGKDVRMCQNFEVEKGAVSGKHTIKANIIYQTCNGDICYPPVREKVDVVIKVR
ncbi:protein-disulfide reductase DsbD domain-containing protein [Flavivirga abyssicola]|uniref:protein-disulfide reductase DsbD domain-containing protein n=1 Tax=Flavivirga abyssicola TaxID=3063533 RepID=UPI0026DF1093|nr:protein-disulfide reductase DsbD domain-containing protein [Flavivirga sp. MEBiC07777]WVK14151.1 protein-disulfide reductase DsbD domain-containing protein [Flavivirga sp. MEBiC07777]